MIKIVLNIEINKGRGVEVSFCGKIIVLICGEKRFIGGL